MFPPPRPKATATRTKDVDEVLAAIEDAMQKASLRTNFHPRIFGLALWNSFITHGPPDHYRQMHCGLSDAALT